jgi:MSHA biogenesis protein MshN
MSVINQSLQTLADRQKPPATPLQQFQQRLQQQRPAMPYIICTLCFLLIALSAWLAPIDEMQMQRILPSLETVAHDTAEIDARTASSEAAPAHPASAAAPPAKAIVSNAQVTSAAAENTVVAAEDAAATAEEGSMVVAASGGKSKEVANLMENARLALQRQDIRSAVNYLTQLQRAKPEHMQSRLLLARLYYQNGEPDVALDTLNQNAQSVTYTAEYLDFRATLFSEAGNYYSAIKDYQRLQILQPNNTKWMLGSAIAYDKLNAYQEAFAAYAQIKEKGDLPTNIDSFIGQRLAVLKDLI